MRWSARTTAARERRYGTLSRPAVIGVQLCGRAAGKPRCRAGQRSWLAAARCVVCRGKLAHRCSPCHHTVAGPSLCTTRSPSSASVTCAPAAALTFPPQRCTARSARPPALCFSFALSVRAWLGGPAMQAAYARKHFLQPASHGQIEVASKQQPNHAAQQLLSSGSHTYSTHSMHSARAAARAAAAAAAAAAPPSAPPTASWDQCIR